MSRLSLVFLVNVLAALLGAHSSLAEDGALVIKSEPRDANIYINGELKASGTPAVVKLPEGTYTLTVNKDGYEDRSLKVQVGGGVMNTQTVTLARAKGVLKVETDPPGARVFVEGRPVSTTPAELQLEPGEHTVALKEPRFRDEELRLSIEAGATVVKRITLQARPREAPTAGSVFKDCGVCPQMVIIPAGAFYMGDLDGGGDSDEYPVHKVTIPLAFALGRFEVTFDEYKVCVWDGVCNAYPDDAGWGQGRMPVINVSWHDAQAYARWLSVKTGREYRLPTEAEWEYAARAGTTTVYYWGDDVGKGCAHSNILDIPRPCSDGHAGTAPVGTFSKNPYGLHDMSGNVLEWVADCVNRNYIGAPNDGSVWTSGDCEENFIARGGAYSYSPFWGRHAARPMFDAGTKKPSTGFRVAASLAGETRSLTRSALPRVGRNDLSSIGTSAPKGTPTESSAQDVDIPGGDLTELGIRNISLAACEAACRKDTRCVAYSYVVEKQWCWPKKTITTYIGKSGVVSQKMR